MEQKKFHIGDHVQQPGVPKINWDKYGKVIHVDDKHQMVEVEHSNGEIGTYGYRQIEKIETKKIRVYLSAKAIMQTSTVIEGAPDRDTAMQKALQDNLNGKIDLTWDYDGIIDGTIEATAALEEP